MAQFKVPSSPRIHTMKFEAFKGVDYASNPTQVKPYRSPEAVNIISDIAGKPTKRAGYMTIHDFGERINGIYRVATEEEERFLVHAGTKLYEWDGDNVTEIYSDMANSRSTAFQHNKRLFILDGQTYLVYGENNDTWECKPVTEVAYVPTAIISRNPDGSGGSQKDQLNMLTNKRVYQFYGDETSKNYHLTVDDSLKIGDGEVIVKVLQSNGTIKTMVEGTDYTVDKRYGIIKFTTAPSKSPATGTDNVYVTFTAEDIEYPAEILNGCTIAVQYGFNGATDRAFLSGNPKVPNFHYWSKDNDPTYFPSFNYAYLGQDSSAIMGYSLIGDALAVHKEDNEQDQTIFLVKGSLDSDGTVAFSIAGSVAGVGAISKHCFTRLDTEPLFLGRQGVHAVTTQYLTAERYAQNRSYYINPKLTAEGDLKEAVAIEYNNYYYLAINGHVYVADGRQKNYEQNAPQSTFQYEWYYLDNIPARVWWEYDGRLFFGTEDGKVKMFKDANKNSASNRVYNDDGEPIRAYWDTPILTMDTISYNKSMKGLWVMTAPYLRSGIKIWYRYKGRMELKKESMLDIFDFNDIDFDRFTFYTDDFPRVIPTNSKLKKFVTCQFRFENDVLNDAFGFYAIELQYTIGGRYKG